MVMTLLMMAVIIIVLVAAMAFLPGLRPASTLLVGAALLMAVAGGQALTSAAGPLWCLPTALPGGGWSLRIDPLSGFFLLLIGAVGAGTSLYGAGYLAGERRPAMTRWAWCAFALLLASMGLVVTAADGLTFLVAWELMAITSFALVVFDDAPAETRWAGWVYLAAAHLGAACLLALFLLLGHAAGSVAFADIALVPPDGSGRLWVWGMALVGFGSKAGFVPMHVWLPEAHPAAPSHASALMSGVMITMGIYGLLRLASLIGAPPLPVAWVLLLFGVLSGVLGSLQAAAQDDVKRLLAYSSIENMGLVAMGLGLAWLGAGLHQPALAAAGYAAALVHVLHHGLGKGALFMAAGAILHATGTRRLDRLGGLIRTMPLTGVQVAVGAGILSGLPPWLGFYSEILLLMAAFRALELPWHLHLLAPGLVIAAVALTAAMATTAFLKAFGVAFLGQPRLHLPKAPHDPLPQMSGAITGLLAVSVLLTILAPAWLPLLAGVLAGLPGLTALDAADSLRAIIAVVAPLQQVSLMLIGLVLAAGLLRHRLLRRRQVALGPTWDCGYARPTARMQVTGTSFSLPLTSLFGPLAGLRQRLSAAEGAQPATLVQTILDPWLHSLYEPLFRRIAAGLGRVHWLHHGNTHLYVLYVALTLVVVTAWGVWP
jgi:formate hydrogenlyase subunit 3/multisubunit Na+/H+ antiporter MnhD subunit